MDRRALVPSDIFSLRTIVDVAMAPSGRHVAFVVHTCEEAADAEYAALWLLDAETGTVSRLTGPGHRDVIPRWAPTGTRLRFLSDRGLGGSPGRPRTNVFELDLERPGEPRIVTDAPEDVSDFIWSPDGTRICVVMKDPGDEAAGQDVAVSYDTMRYSDPPFTSWVDGRAEHLWTVDDDGAMHRLTGGEASDHSPTWSPDGRQIAFVTNRRSDREFREAADIWIVPADGSDRARPLIQPSVGSEWDGSPAFAPNGEEIAYVGVADSGERQFHPHPHLIVAPLDGGAAHDLVASWDRPIGNHLLTETRRHAGAPPAVWSRNGEALFVVGTDRGTAHLYRVDREGDGCEDLTPGDHEVAAFSLDGDRRRFAAVMTSASMPTEIFLGEVGDALSQATTLNIELTRSRHIGDLEQFTFRASDGCEIEGWLVKPPGFHPGKRYSMILRIAGGPGLAYGHSFVEDSHVLAGEGHVVCFINPRGTQSYGAEFTSALDGGWLGIDYEDQLAAVDHVISLGFVDPGRVGVMGASYGGLMVNWIVTQTSRFAAAVSQRSISNLISIMAVGPLITNLVIPDFKAANPYLEPSAYVAKSPLTHVANVETPILLMQAGLDCMTPVSQAQEFFVALRMLGKRARLVVYPEGQHYLRRYGRPSERLHYMKTIASWFSDHLRAGETT